MKALILVGLLSAVALATAADAVTLRVRFGMKDAEGTDWSGSVTATPGKVVEIHGWRWTPMDKAEGNEWTVKTRSIPVQSSAQREKVRAGKPMPIGDNGVIITLVDVMPSSEIVITTKPGEAKFKLSDLPFGKRLLRLEGNLEIERAPVAAAVAETPADEDYPAAVADRDGNVYVAYVAFTRGKDFPGAREAVATPEVKPAIEARAAKARLIAKPEDLDYLAQKTGGDQVQLRVCKGGVWGEPMPVSKAGGDVYRPALALDGAGRAWVFYSSHVNPDANLDHGNWELMARCYADGKLDKPVNVSNSPGPDFAPAAATDASGKIVVTWMSGRGQSFDIFAATQDGDKFGAPVAIAATPANEWDPAIAADKKGNVAIAWDTYEKGDHDICVALRGADGAFGKATPVAATLDFEVRPAVAYDGQGDLWIVWEQSGENWGKDFGALKKTGIGIFTGGRSLGSKVLRNGTEWLQPPPIVAAPAVVAGKGKGKGKARAAKSAGARTQGARQQMAPCFPRLATDAQGKVWLAFRGRPPGGEWRVASGPIFNEFVTRMDGERWLAPVWLPRSDNILDNRPGWAALPNGDMLLAYSGDGRAAVHPPYGGGGKGAGKKTAGAGAAPDPNNTVFVATISRVEAAPAAQLAVVSAEKPATPAPAVAEEAAAANTLRDYRVKLGNETLRLWRGEFHRHTELSSDGGGDGTLLDMYRYALDASYMDWVGNGDHDNGNGREYSWWITQKTVTLFTLPGAFVPMYSYERSVNYPEGHRNPVFAKRGVRTLPRLPLSDPKLENPPPAPDTELLYKYLRRFDGVCAEHTSATDMGTDWRNNDPVVEPFVEIYQGCRNNYERPDAPRSAVSESKSKLTAVEGESIGGWRPKGMVNLALKKGYRLAFQSSSDHGSTHLSYCNVWVPEPTREAILDAMKKRRVYAATDHILADMRCKAGGKEHFMGEEFTTAKLPTLDIKLVGVKPLARVTIIKDDEVVHTFEPNQKEASVNWTDTKATPGQTSYYYVRGEQVPDIEGATGEIVWVSPMWIKYQP
ncbi:MAG: hypothetical protein HZC54_03290 [Verrucomicrobia bacterium]|nr:hypothetical protein [Verrucomicrobiota bacterium]